MTDLRFRRAISTDLFVESAKVRAFEDTYLCSVAV